ncbi:MAG: phosphoribosylformylglycinamidine cyclo-ligase [Puniceicoccaceae bacterium]|nr:MAG: phosphoribosylformylglycinamidine cyclo-ligase [Puniceicoccaceae bacterium]
MPPARKKPTQPRISAATSAAYARAGVDLALGDRVKSGLGGLLAGTRRPEVLGAVGGFGGLFDISRLPHKSPVLVASIDGVGTKLKLAFATGKHEVVGADLVNHCVNDIAVLGAEPLFFLDYLGLGKLDRAVFGKLLRGMARACRQAGCALLGGETAQMPGFYAPGEYDLAGCIVGVADKNRLLTGEAIRPGDVLVGLPSSGLHTNGYSLARKILLEDAGLAMTDRIPETRLTVGGFLLRPHLNYGPLLVEAVARLNPGNGTKSRRGRGLFGAAHITGGGFAGNLPRILPEGCTAIVRTGTWDPGPAFPMLEKLGKLDREEAHAAFNMGIGMVLVAAPSAAGTLVELAKPHGHRAVVIGEVVRGHRGVVLQD